MPYLPFPPNWPSFLPKDMVAGWLETYAWAMECNVWTGTNFLGGDLRRGCGHLECAACAGPTASERVLQPRHIVFANGIVGQPDAPEACRASTTSGAR